MLPYSLYFSIKSLVNSKESQTCNGLVAKDHCQVTYCCLERLTLYEHILGSGDMAPHILKFGPYEGVYSFKPRSLYFRIHFIECWAVVQPIWASWLRDVSLSAASNRNLNHPVTNQTELSLFVLLIFIHVCVFCCVLPLAKMLGTAGQALEPA
jgi:hypothetical protein